MQGHRRQARLARLLCASPCQGAARAQACRPAPLQPRTDLLAAKHAPHITPEKVEAYHVGSLAAQGWGGRWGRRSTAGEGLWGAQQRRRAAPAQGQASQPSCRPPKSAQQRALNSSHAPGARGLRG